VGGVRPRMGKSLDQAHHAGRVWEERGSPYSVRGEKKKSNERGGRVLFTKGVATKSGRHGKDYPDGGNTREGRGKRIRAQAAEGKDRRFAKYLGKKRSLIAQMWGVRNAEIGPNGQKRAIGEKAVSELSVLSEVPAEKRQTRKKEGKRQCFNSKGRN